MSDLLRIDGSRGEGGGQILRTSLSLACITGRPIELYNIRAKRDKPGLRPQHLQCVKAAAHICSGRLQGAEVGSTRIAFEPGPIRPGEYRFDIGTAGATSLVFHTVVYPLSFARSPSRVVITGGTHNPMSPCYHYMALAWAPLLGQLGFNIDLGIAAAGFYPKGGGEISATVSPADALRPLRLRERGRLSAIEGISGVANLKLSIAERQAKSASTRLKAMGIDCPFEVCDMPAASPGTVLLVNAVFEHGRACYFGLGEVRKRAETVADEACRDLQRFMKSSATVDEHLADQLLIPLAFCEGESIFMPPVVTTHLTTNADVIGLFWPARIETGHVGEKTHVRVTGKTLDAPNRT